MTNEDKKDFNAMLKDSKDMTKFQTITDEQSIKSTAEARRILHRQPTTTLL